MRSAPVPIVIRSLKVFFGMPRPLFALKMFGGWPLGAVCVDARISCMFAAVFSCTMTSTLAGNSTFPLTWSP